MDRRDPALVDPYKYYNDPDDLRVVYQKMILYAAMPILLAIISFIVWAILAKIYKFSKEARFQRFIATLVFLLFYSSQQFSDLFIFTSDNFLLETMLN